MVVKEPEPQQEPQEQPQQGPQEDKPIEQQAIEQTGQRQVRLKIDERNVETTYANAFRGHAGVEEVILDFGLNLINPVAAQEGQQEIIFQVNQRVILNYYSAKRLALTLGQMIRRHEEQFGVLELDVSKRARKSE